MTRPSAIYDRAMHEARRYWRDRLEAMAFDSHLAPDHPRPRDRGPQPTALEQVLDPEAHARLQRLTGGNPFLSYTALVTALQVCCYRYSGRRAVTLFVPGAEPAVASALPISCTLDGGASFKDTLLANRELLATAYRHQQYPFSRLVLDLRDARRPEHLFLIASLAGFGGDPSDDAWDLAVRFEIGDGRTVATLRFDPRVHAAATVRQLFATAGDVLRDGLGEMTARIAELPRDRPPPPDGAPARGGAPDPGSSEATDEVAGLRDRLAAQVAARPGQVAVVHGDRVTTYAALDRHAARLAEVLAALSLDLRRPVALVMEAGTELVAAMLAVLKIGGGFAPIAPRTAEGSVARLLEALRPECIVCQRDHQDLIPRPGSGSSRAAHLVAVDRAGPGGDWASSVELAAPPQPAGAADPGDGDPAGADRVWLSAERPGGAVTTVPVRHAELVAVLDWLARRCGVGPHDRCLLWPGTAGCGQLHDLLGMLIAGASVEIADAASLQDPARLAERLLAPEITLWDLPTALAQNLLAELVARRAGRPGPRTILITGEHQCPALWARLARGFPDARITGLYAHPAIGLWSTVFVPGDGAVPDAIAIAEPIPGFEHRILHDTGEPVPVHARGELHLQRAAPAAGPRPPSIRTGLTAQRLAGGRLGWLRGADHELVRHDCHVALSRLEAILCQHEHVLAAEVIPVAAAPGADPRVVAFLVAGPDPVSADAARDFLVLRGDVDLIPDHAVVLDGFPLADDGAIDRDALVARFAAAHDTGGDARRDELDAIHRRLKAIWLELLELDEVGDHDSFFASGGNSLKATLLIARIRDDFAVDLSVQQFFREPSTHAVARLIAAEAGTAARPQARSELKAVPRDRYRVPVPDLER